MLEQALFTIVYPASKINNASDLLVRQLIKMLENHYLLLKLY